jgi:hypothetical protein
MLSQRLDNSEPRRPAKWACLEAHLPDQSPMGVGVLLVEPSSDRLYIRIKPDWWNDLVDGEEGQIWEGLSEDLKLKAEQMGATEFLKWLEDCCSHSIRIGAIQNVDMRQPETCANALYREHIHASAITLVVRNVSAPGLLTVLFRGQRQSVLTRSVHILSKNYRWAAQAALAASMLVVGWIAGYHASRQIQAERNNTSVSKAIELPLVSDFHYQHVQLNLRSYSRPSRRKPHRRKTHGSTEPVRPFVLVHRVVKHQEIQVAKIQPLLLPANYTPSSESVPPHLLSEPELPEYRPRHNRFVRILAAVTIPVRVIASR